MLWLLGRMDPRTIRGQAPAGVSGLPVFLFPSHTPATVPSLMPGALEVVGAPPAPWQEERELSARGQPAW